MKKHIRWHSVGCSLSIAALNVSTSAKELMIDNVWFNCLKAGAEIHTKNQQCCGFSNIFV